MNELCGVPCSTGLYLESVDESQCMTWAFYERGGNDGDSKR
jgi:hypothetical protein